MTVLSDRFKLAFLAGVAFFGLCADLDLVTALAPSGFLLFEVFRFAGTRLSGSYRNNGYRG